MNFQVSFTMSKLETRIILLIYYWWIDFEVIFLLTNTVVFKLYLDKWQVVNLLNRRCLNSQEPFRTCEVSKRRVKAGHWDMKHAAGASCNDILQTCLSDYSFRLKVNVYIYFRVTFVITSFMFTIMYFFLYDPNFFLSPAVSESSVSLAIFQSTVLKEKSKNVKNHVLPNTFLRY